jgi:hypothetical protein
MRFYRPVVSLDRRLGGEGLNLQSLDVLLTFIDVTLYVTIISEEKTKEHFSSPFL